MKLKLDQSLLLQCKEFCYFLGLIYSDGSVKQYKDYKYNVVYYTTENNIKYFKDIFNVFADFKMRTNQSKNWKRRYVYDFTNKDLYFFLINIGFNNKLENANKILSYINSDECKKAFFTGYFDGDGCVYYNEKQYLRRAEISGSYDQNWDFIIDVCEKLNIKNYKIQRCIKKHGHKNSCFSICNKKEFKIFLSYIYDNTDFGFQRKKEKYNEALLLFKNQNPELRNNKNLAHYSSIN
jgi:intein/homing endonuclease